MGMRRALGVRVDPSPALGYLPGVANTVTLKNTTKRMLVFNLPREHVPEAAQRVPVARASHDVTPVHGKKDAPSSDTAGKRSVAVRQETVSGSVTFLAGETKTLPASVLLAPEVKKALSASPAKLVRVEEQTPATPAPAAKPEAKKTPKKGGDGGN